MIDENKTSQGIKNSYFWAPTNKPYAWIFFLYACLFLPLAGSLGKILAIFPFLFFIVQVIVNIKNSGKEESRLNVKKISINVILLVILGVLWSLLKNLQQ